MPAALAAAATLLALGAAGDPRLTGEVLAFGGVRVIQPERGPAVRFVELEVDPRVSLLAGTALRLELAYLPRLYMPVDAASGPAGPEAPSLSTGTVSVLHRAELRLEAQAPRRRLYALAAVVRGETDLFGVSFDSAQPLPTLSRVAYRSFEGTAGLSASLQPRTAFALSATAFQSSSGDALSAAALPLQRGLRLEGSLGWSATRRTELSAGVSGQAARTDPGNDSAFVRAGAVLRRAVAPTFSLRLAGGASAAAERVQGGAASFFRPLPYAEASASLVPFGPLSGAEASVGVEPVIDRLTGNVEVRLAAQARLGWSPSRSWTVTATALGAALRPWTDIERVFRDAGVWLGAADLRAQRRLGPHATVAAVAWTSWQNSERPETPSFHDVAFRVEVAASMGRGITRPSPGGAAAPPATEETGPTPGPEGPGRAP